MSLDTLILGAGVTGLCAANHLAKSIGRDSILILEASDRPGGYARTDRIDGFLCDHGPNGFLDRDPAILAWIDELGLTSELVRANESAAHRFILKNDQLIEIKPPPALFTSGILSLGGIARLLLEPFIKPRRDISPESIWHFAARRIGPEAADTLVQPLVTGVFGGDARQLSLEHCFPRIAALEREHGSLFKALRAMKGAAFGPRGTLTSFQAGMGRLCERAAGISPLEGGQGGVTPLANRIRYNTPATAISRKGDHYVIATPAGAIEAERVICTLPPGAAAQLTANFDADLSATLRRIPHAPIAVVCAAYPREAVGHDMNGFGFLVPRTERKRLLGCIWTSTVFPNSAPPDHVFIRCMFGGTTDPAAVTLTDNELRDLLTREVHPLLRILSAPDFLKIFRHSIGIPQYPLDHADILAQLDAAQTRHPNFTLAGNAYRGVSLIDCVASAQRAAQTGPSSTPKT